MKWIRFSHVLPWMVILAGCAAAQKQPGLQIVFGDRGIQQLKYNNVVLEDSNTFSTDVFHIGHMKMTDTAGNVLAGNQHDWGEVNKSRSWNLATRTWTYRFDWGLVSVQFVQSGDALDLNVTETNQANSGVILDGATIYPFVLHFPRLPEGFVNPRYQQIALDKTGPSVTVADFGGGEVGSVVADASKPLYSGFLPADGAANAYVPVISGTAIDNMAAFFPRADRPVRPGQSDRFTVSLRFAPSGTPASSLAADAYRDWSKSWPAQLHWSDRRIIGTVYLASSPQGARNQAGGYPNNPRRYFNNSNPNEFDIRSVDGLAVFQRRILQQADSNVQNLRKLNAQGAITWDIEGEQYPQDTSYVCEPDEIAQIAPEMESVISDGSSPYRGMKLDDAYFKIMRDAGFKVGVCIRPQHFTLQPDGTANQETLPEAQVASELIRKMRYAHERWGATLFYVDSSVTALGFALDASVFQEAAAELPDSLIMPEESTTKDYAYTAPFQSFIFHRDLGTPPNVRNYYPQAFSVNLVNDVDAGTLAKDRTQLTEAVRGGDILMVHADYWQQNNPTVVQMYWDAGAKKSASHVSGP